MSDLEGRGGGDHWGFHGIRVLPVDRPCTRRVTWGSTDGLSPIVLRAQHSFSFEEEYMCKQFT